MVSDSIQVLANNIITLAVMILVTGAIAYGLTVAFTEPGKKRSFVAQVMFGMALLITVFVWNRFILN
jgi:hypothetical protein